MPSNHRRGDAAHDDEDHPWNSEQAIASNDAVNGMGQQPWVARASRMRVPKQARGDVPEERDDRSDVKKLEPEVHG